MLPPQEGISAHQQVDGLHSGRANSAQLPAHSQTHQVLEVDTKMQQWII
jgi:hypothetical protein